jgi:hypothetical protein
VLVNQREPELFYVDRPVYRLYARHLAAPRSWLGTCEAGEVSL